MVDQDRRCQEYRLGEVESCAGHQPRSLLGIRVEVTGTARWSHFTSAALAVGYLPEWLLCTFPAWIAGVGGSFRTAEEVFSPEACSASARVSAC